MKKQLQFDFSVNRENNTITIKREYDATLQQVWDAWTIPEMIDKWWGPKPWRAETKSMDFRDGGHWLYAMVGPEGERHWGKTDYITIKPKQLIHSRDGFSDENGILDQNLPQNSWEVTFSEKDGTTLLEMLSTFDRPEDLDTNLNMGFREGFTAGLDQLEELLESK